MELKNQEGNDFGRILNSHHNTLQSFIFKCLEKGESIDAGDFLPSHYTLVHYVSDCKKLVAKAIGIDYGTKRVGIAISESSKSVRLTSSSKCHSLIFL